MNQTLSGFRTYQTLSGLRTQTTAKKKEAKSNPTSHQQRNTTPTTETNTTQNIKTKTKVASKHSGMMTAKQQPGTLQISTDLKQTRAPRSSKVKKKPKQSCKSTTLFCNDPSPRSPKPPTRNSKEAR